MRGTKRVPQRKHGVVREVGRLVNLEIAPAILSVHVHEKVGRGHRVKKAGIEICKLGVGAAGNGYFTELAIPRSGRVRSDLVEIPVIDLRAKIAQRAFRADG